MPAKLLRMRHRHLLPSALAWLLAAAAHASNVTFDQLSNNSIVDGKPRIAAGQVAWQAGPDASSEIRLWNGSTIVNVTAQPARDIDPELSDTFLIWKHTSDGTTCALEIYDFTNPFDALDSSFSCSNDIRVAGTHVSWADAGFGSGDDVFVSTDHLDPERLGQNTADDGDARVGDVAGNPRAVFVAQPLIGGDDLVYWNGSTEKVIADAPPSSLRSQIRMDGSRIVWVDQDKDDGGSDLEIFYFNGSGDPIQLTHNDFDDEQPDVHGQDVVWRGFPDDPNSGEIYHYDGTTTTRVTNDAFDDRAPRVSKGADGTTIAWVKDDGGDEDVWVFDGCESTDVTGPPNLTSGPADADAVIDGNEIAWVRGSGTATEVWHAKVLCDVACGNGELEPGEECDDGNTVDLDGCSAQCLEEICGNSRIDPGETCDDGNTVGDDRCDASCQVECGNGNMDGAEECDDDNTANNDGCDSQCFKEICGNDHLQQHIGEECDDGNTADGDGCSSTCLVEHPIEPAKQNCITQMNTRGSAAAKAQHDLGAYCLGGAAKGTIPDAQGCLTADPKGKVAKATAKTTSTDAKACPAANQPTFGYTGAATVNAAAAGPTSQPFSMVADLFGANLTAAVIPKATDAKAAKCQKSALTATNALADRLYKLTLKEKTALLAGKTDGSTAISADALTRQLEDFLTADSDGKIAKKQTSLRNSVRSSCTGVDIAAAFPGCMPATINLLADCAQAAARCRFCLGLDAMDALAIDCDAFDDTAANASCP